MSHIAAVTAVRASAAPVAAPRPPAKAAAAKTADGKAPQKGAASASVNRALAGNGGPPAPAWRMPTDPLAGALGLRPAPQAEGRYETASLAPAYSRGRSAATALDAFDAPDAPRATTIAVLSAAFHLRLTQDAARTATAPATKTAEAAPSRFLRSAGPAAATVAAAKPGWAEAPAGPVAPLAADRALMRELDQVNSRINAAIRYVSDSKLFGDEDYWHLSLYPGGPAAGDCKDYVLEKKRALIAEGVPAANLSIAIVQTGWGETHAVLLVNTDQGELVMDSLSAWVRPWRSVHYRWIERQAPGQQLNWVAIG